jgi:hypothetical protein
VEREETDMTALVERIVQKISDAAPLENAVSVLVAGVLENTATKLAGGEPVQPEQNDDEDA